MKDPLLLDELLVNDGPPAYQADHIPTLDNDVPVATYTDWDPKDTRIIVCAIATSAYPGERYETRDRARAATELKYGRILEANYVPGRAFFRVYRQRPMKVQ